MNNRNIVSQTRLVRPQSRFHFMIGTFLMAGFLKQSKITDSEKYQPVKVEAAKCKEHFRINTETIFLPASDWYV
jgi:hypothetical protein